jgi:polysaccharide export outer membrane protein
LTLIRHIFLVFIILCSCKSYKQDILFQYDERFTAEDLAIATEVVESNYVLKPNDILLLDVFTNKGERLIDPNFELTQGGNPQAQLQRDRFNYIIQIDGTVQIPIVGKFNVEGMTLNDAELQVAKAFGNIYKDPFVKLRVNNRRVFVLGAPGGQVIPLSTENVSIVEILALAGGVDLGAKAQNIKLIRGDLVFEVDLSTVSGLKESSLIVESGDVIYIEPIRRVWRQTLTDVSPILSLSSSILALILVIQNL